MNPIPTGRLFPTDGGRDLVLTRTFDAPIDDVWESITVSERTERWFGSWWGEAGEGRTIHYRMTFEEGGPEGSMTIVRCQPPQLLAVTTSDEGGAWHLEARLEEADGVTVLTFVHHLDPGADPGDIGPGWEFYLDLLVWSRSGGAQPEFDDYLPQRSHYESQL